MTGGAITPGRIRGIGHPAAFTPRLLIGEPNGEKNEVPAGLRRWWWIPVSLLALLLVKAWIVAGIVQDQARTLAADAAGIDEDRVEMVDGLDVRLVGFTDEASRDAAVASVDELDATWEVVGIVDGEPAGDATGGTASEPDGTAVASDETAPAPAAGTAGPEPTIEDDAAPTSAFEPPAIELAVGADGAVVVRGTVGDEATRIAILAEVERFAGGRDVTDELLVAPDVAGVGGGTLTITGGVTSTEQRQALIDGASSIAEAAGLDLVDQTTVDDEPADEQPVDEEPADEEGELNALFELEPIEFGYNTAIIGTASTATLDLAAAIMNASEPGTVFRVVGHTDSDGDADDNLRLSQARADAVVAYLVEVGGVDGTRLEADGRGETELKFDPEANSNDKRRNRRIEWERVE